MSVNALNFFLKKNYIINQIPILIHQIVLLNLFIIKFINHE